MLAMIRILTLLSISAFAVMLAMGQHQAGFEHPLLLPGLLLISMGFAGLAATFGLYVNLQLSLIPVLALATVLLTALRWISAP